MLRQVPCFGDGMRPYADGVVSESLKVFESTPGRPLTVHVLWGENHINSNHQNKNDPIWAELTIHGLGRDPAFALIKRTTQSYSSSFSQKDHVLSIQWNTQDDHYTEYLATLRLYKNDDANVVPGQHLLLQRTLHAIPPTPIQYNIPDILWAPGLVHQEQELDEEDLLEEEKKSQDNETDHHHVTTSTTNATFYTRRGFGFELETVTLPPSQDQREKLGLFSHQHILQNAIDRMNHDQSASASSRKHSQIQTNMRQWQVASDLQVENAAPFARLHLWKQFQRQFRNKHNNINSKINQEHEDNIRRLILAGRQQQTDDWTDEELIAHAGQSVASPEYKSPAPPNALYYSFPTTSSTASLTNGTTDAAEKEIEIFLQQVLQNPHANNPHSGILCPTVSAIGMSASSIHVHINICHATSHPIPPIHSSSHVGGDLANSTDDLQLTKSLLNVVLNWIRFDGVTGRLAKSWMWRDRDLMPLFAQGPECTNSEMSWNHGTTVDPGPHQSWNVAAFVKEAVTKYLQHERRVADEEDTMAREKHNPHAEEEDEIDTSLSTTDPSSGGSDENEDDDVEDADYGNDDVDNENYGSSLFGSSSSKKQDTATYDSKEDSTESRDDNTRNQKYEPTRPFPILESVFDHDMITRTLSRKCSLNLLSLKSYGTVEVRRYHGSLNPQVVSAWTRLCVGFVEYFMRPENQDLVNACVGCGADERGMMKVLIDFQNKASLEMLMELLSSRTTRAKSKNVPTLSPSTFDVLLQEAGIQL